MTMLGDAIEVPGWAASPAVRAAEAALIGAIIRSRANAEAAGETLTAADFAEPSHSLIFGVVMDLTERGNPVDETVVLGELTKRGILAQVGGGSALLDFAERAAVGPSIGYHAQVIAGDALRRRLHSAATTVQQMTSRHDFDPADIDLIRKTIDSAAEMVTGDEPPLVGDLLPDVLDALESPLSTEDTVPPPYMDLEMLLMGGLRAGQMIVLGARPAMGKSLVAMDIARAAAVRLGLPTMVFSLEMSRNELMHRLIAAEASVNLDRLITHQVTDDDWNRIGKARDRIMAAPMLIDDSPKCTLARIRARLRGMQRKTPARLVVIDYLQLMEAPRAESRERGVSEISRGIKLLAKEFHVPIVLLAQLNRGPEQRTDKRPVPSDLRESGSIEQDADVVMLLHREDAYDKESPRAGELDVIVGKNRSGPMSTVTVAFQGRYARAVDMYQER